MFTRRNTIYTPMGVGESVLVIMEDSDLVPMEDSNLVPMRL